MNIEITGFEQRVAPDGHPVSIWKAIIGGEQRTIADVTSGWLDAVTGEDIGSGLAFLDAIDSWRARTAVPEAPSPTILDEVRELASAAAFAGPDHAAEAVYYSALRDIHDLLSDDSEEGS